MKEKQNVVVMYHLLESCMTQASSSDNIAENDLISISVVAAFLKPDPLSVCLRTRDTPYESFGDVAIN